MGVPTFKCAKKVGGISAVRVCVCACTHARACVNEVGRKRSVCEVTVCLRESLL